MLVTGERFIDGEKIKLQIGRNTGGAREWVVRVWDIRGADELVQEWKFEDLTDALIKYNAINSWM